MGRGLLPPCPPMVWSLGAGGCRPLPHGMVVICTILLRCMVPGGWGLPPPQTRFNAGAQDPGPGQGAVRARAGLGPDPARALRRPEAALTSACSQSSSNPSVQHPIQASHIQSKFLTSIPVQTPQIQPKSPMFNPNPWNAVRTLPDGSPRDPKGPKWPSPRSPRETLGALGP